MAKNNFYAVAVGRKTGVFDSWDEAEESIKGFGGAKYRGFKTYSQASAYVLKHQDEDEKFREDYENYEHKLGEALELAQKRWHYDWILTQNGKVVDFNIESLMDWYVKECK